MIHVRGEIADAQEDRLKIVISSSDDLVYLDRRVQYGI